VADELRKEVLHAYPKPTEPSYLADAIIEHANRSPAAAPPGSLGPICCSSSGSFERLWVATESKGELMSVDSVARCWAPGCHEGEGPVARGTERPLAGSILRHPGWRHSCLSGVSRPYHSTVTSRASAMRSAAGPLGGWLATASRNVARSSASSTTPARARTVAVRGTSRTSAISPNPSPVLRVTWNAPPRKTSRSPAAIRLETGRRFRPR